MGSRAMASKAMGTRAEEEVLAEEEEDLVRTSTGPTRIGTETTMATMISLTSSQQVVTAKAATMPKDPSEGETMASTTTEAGEASIPEEVTHQGPMTPTSMGTSLRTDPMEVLAEVATSTTTRDLAMAHPMEAISRTTSHQATSQMGIRATTLARMDLQAMAEEAISRMSREVRASMEAAAMAEVATTTDSMTRTSSPPTSRPSVATQEATRTTTTSSKEATTDMETTTTDLGATTGLEETRTKVETSQAEEEEVSLAEVVDTLPEDTMMTTMGETPIQEEASAEVVLHSNQTRVKEDLEEAEAEQPLTLKVARECRESLPGR